MGIVFKSPSRTNPKGLCLEANATVPTEQMQSFFSARSKTCVPRTRAHLLTDILIIGILAVIAGGKGWEDMVLWFG